MTDILIESLYSTGGYCYVSLNGKDYELIHSVGRTDFITPTHYGLVANQGTTSIATTVTRAQAKIFHLTLA